MLLPNHLAQVLDEALRGHVLFLKLAHLEEVPVDHIGALESLADRVKKVEVECFRTDTDLSVPIPRPSSPTFGLASPPPS